MARPKIIVVTGPTAGGKSDLALALAQKLNGEIIVLDSVQVYRGADIGSAKASKAEQTQVPHHLIDILEPTEQCDVAQFIGRAGAVITDCVERGKVAVVVGGTTMYLTALLHGLAEAPKASPALRAELEALTSGELWQRLLVCDQEAAERLHPNDRLRIIRAIERVELGGPSGGVVAADHGYRDVSYRALIIAPLWERGALQRRIETRTEAMLHAGIETEAKRLSGQGASRGLLSAVGYRQVLAGQKGEDLRRAIITATRRYAKRQMTYLRNEPSKRGWRVRPGPDDTGVRLLSQQYGSVRSDAAVAVMVLPQHELARRIQKWHQSKAVFTDERPELWLIDGAVALTP